MAKWCPITKTKVIYTTCTECEEKLCKKATSQDKKETRYEDNKKK